MKDENTRLKSLALNFEDIERMKWENKQMRLELQKLKMIAMSDANSTYNLDNSPTSININNGSFEEEEL